MLAKLQVWVKENPNRGRTVSPIEIRVCSDTQEGETEVGPASTGGWVPTPLEPPGPVSLWLWKTDPEFRAGTAQVRRTILRDQILKITERVEQELRGVKWQRKKVGEQLAAQQTAAVSPPMDTPELDRGLAHLFGYQKVVVDEAGKKVRFFPADPRTWSTELPVWAGTTGARAVLHRPGEGAVGHGLARWLQDRESEGWAVDWPIADGGIEDLKARLEERGLRVGGGGGLVAEKPKKADYAAALGRAEAIEHIMGWANA
jgi:hypothetical protein